jgi:hypothetical protein
MPTEDPCVRLERLRSVREALIMGRATAETSFSGRTVRYAKADLPALDREIAAAELACSQAQGGTPKRRRFAMGARFRPH